VAFFRRSGLPNEVLAKIWALSDAQRRGFLDRPAFARALALIALAQRGAPVSQESYLQFMSGAAPPDLPALEGVGELLAHGAAAPFDAPRGASHAAAGPSGHGEGPRGPGGAPAPAMGVAQHTTGSFIGPAPTKRDEREHRAYMKGKVPKQVPMQVVTSITDGLKAIYYQKIKPLEDLYKFPSFFASTLRDGDFDAKPLLLLLGAYSAGKSTFVQHLLGREYPGCHIGPEPTTDRFVVVMEGAQDRTTPGNTLAVDPSKPFQGLQQFGSGFLGRLMGAQCPSRLLQELTIVDTPGVLSGRKQVEREYSFQDITSWFALRADQIVLIFDPNKLDISDEFMQVPPGGTLRRPRPPPRPAAAPATPGAAPAPRRSSGPSACTTTRSRSCSTSRTRSRRRS